MSEVRKYVVARWDPAYKNCLSIVLPDGSLLLQASNAYTRDQWYHSILWKVFKKEKDVDTLSRRSILLESMKSTIARAEGKKR